MLSTKDMKKLAKKYAVPVDAIRQLANELDKTGGISVRFDIAALGGKGLWKVNKPASVGNGFNTELNELVTKLCNDLSNMIRNQAEDEPAKKSKKPALDDTVGLVPVSLHISAWWPEAYGEVADEVGTVAGMRFAYFEFMDRLVIRQSLRNRIFDTSGHRVQSVRTGQEPGFFNLVVETENGDLPITDLHEVAE